MNADVPTFDPVEVAQFCQFWLTLTGVDHITLVSIQPDAGTDARTFHRGDDYEMATWVGEAQRAGRNVYFQPNETFPDCASKAAKNQMMAGLCRFADIDPADGFPLADERDRLSRLADHLNNDPTYQPTVIIDSGNGAQVIWATAREVLSPFIIARIEAETKAIETALGAGGTHNIDRLLRLPGTLNFPNATKRAKGRGLGRARLIYNADTLYTAEQIADLATHLTATLPADLVQLKPKPTGPSAPDKDADIAALAAELTKAGADAITTKEDLSDDLQQRLDAALKAKPHLADRWAGMVDDLTEAGRDSSRSALDMSLAAMLKGAKFNHLDAGLILCAFAHGKANGGPWAGNARLRHVARCVLRSHEPTPDHLAIVIAEMNARYMVVNEAGKAIVYEPTYDVGHNRRYHERITFEDLRKLHLNRRIRIPHGNGNTALKPVADVWLNHPDRRQFIGGVIFDPSGRHVRPDMLNLWQGFAVEPRPGSWARLQEHILKIVCAGDTNLCDWLMGWMARLVQYPSEQGEVAVVMRGIEGCGKGTLAKALLHILGQHGMAISNAKHLTGNFNGHLRDTVLLFADEAFFAGDRAHVGVLKALITEPTLTIEAKYANAVQMPNFVHLMMASNEEWVIPAGPEARRFLVLDVLPARAEDTAYFAAIWGEMKNGGYEAMLHDLLAYDLTFFNHRNAPKTAGLQEQKKLSLGTSEGWWMDVLHRGYVYKSKLGLDDHFGQWHETVTTEMLFGSYAEYAKAKNERHPMAREAFGRFMISMGATTAKHRNGVVGEHVTDVTVNKYGDTKRLATLIKRPLATAYRTRHAGTGAKRVPRCN